MIGAEFRKLKEHCYAVLCPLAVLCTHNVRML